MKKIMVVGAIGSGKTSLLMAMHGELGIAPKTQTLKYKHFIIDTPGEYIENPFMHKAIITTSTEVKYIIFTQDSTTNKVVFPPGFAKIFNCMSLGVITKIDDPKANVEKANRYLQQLRLRGPIFKVSAFTGDGVNELKSYINFDD